MAFALFLLVKAGGEEKLPPSAPSTNPYSYCLSVIPLKSIRCLNCMSDRGQYLESELAVSKKVSPKTLKSIKK